MTDTPGRRLNCNRDPTESGVAFCPAVPGLAPEASIKSIAIAGIQRLLLCTGLRSRAGPCSPLRNEHGDQAGRVTAAAGEDPKVGGQECGPVAEGAGFPRRLGMLGLVDVRTSLYDPAFDLAQACRQP